MLSALADGEFSTDQLALVHQHLADCPQCTSAALAQSLLKSAAGRAGQRYTLPRELGERLAHLASQEASRRQGSPSADAAAKRTRGAGVYAWAAAAAVLLVCVSLLFIARNAQRDSAASLEFAELVTEVCDQHIATLAANSPPEVISSDRHTVKPWFQGRIPFSFNLPQNLPADTTLDGANLTYLHDQPTAQLLYSIGKHRVSVFIQQRTDGSATTSLSADRAGFHVTGFLTADLEAVAVSDVDPVRLFDLMGRIEHAQAGAQPQSK